MKLTLAALAATLALAPPAFADVTLRCDWHDGTAPDIYVITGNTARVEAGNGTSLAYQQVEETSTQFKLSGYATEPDTTVVINRITGAIDISGKSHSGSILHSPTGQCVLASAKF